MSSPVQEMWWSRMKSAGATSARTASTIFREGHTWPPTDPTSALMTLSVIFMRGASVAILAPRPRGPRAASDVVAGGLVRSQRCALAGRPDFEHHRGGGTRLRAPARGDAAAPHRGARNPLAPAARGAAQGPPRALRAAAARRTGVRGPGAADRRAADGLAAPHRRVP